MAARGDEPAAVAPSTCAVGRNRWGLFTRRIVMATRRAARCVPLLLVCCVLAGCEVQYLDFQQKIVSPDGQRVFALFSDYYGIGDPSWYVFVLDSSQKPEQMSMPLNCWNKRPRADWLVMRNWSESGVDMGDPHIELIDDRYLVMVRGGLYHGVYNVQTDITLFQDICPWHTWYTGTEGAKGINYEDHKPILHDWEKATIHERCRAIIEGRTRDDEPEFDEAMVCEALSGFLARLRLGMTEAVAELGVEMSPMPVEVQFISGAARGKSLLIRAKVKGMCKAGTYSGAVHFDLDVLPDGGRLIFKRVDFCGGPP